MKKNAQLNTIEWEILGQRGFCGYSHSGSGTILKLEGVIESEPNAAFKTRVLSSFPTAIFELASVQYITALIRLADFEDYIYLFWNWKTHFLKTHMPSHVCQFSETVLSFLICALILDNINVGAYNALYD